MGAFSEMNIGGETGEDGFTQRAAAPFQAAVQMTVLPAFEDMDAGAETPPPPEALEPQAHQDIPTQEPAAPKAAEEKSNPAADVEKRRAEHEAAEAKRKAEWDAKQEAKKKTEREALAKLEAMSDDEAMMDSMKRVSADTEKLTRRNMKDCVSEYIQTKCLEDPAFARLVMHPRKTMIHCFQYINHKAWEYVQDELKASGIQPGPGAQAYSSDIPDDLCYQWAEDYFHAQDAKEDRVETEKFVPKPFNGGYSGRKTAKKAEKKTEKKPAVKKEPAAKEPGFAQFSLLDAVQEAKAG